MRFTSVLACAFLLSVACLAQTIAPIQLYDNFNTTWIDPGKWAAVPTCSATQFLDTTASVNVFDCIRAIQGNKLRLMVKAYGHTDSDTDRQFAPSELYFANPNGIHSISATARIAHTAPTACPSNATDSFGQILTGGNFFNIGTGDPKDDVTVIILVQHLATDPKGVAHSGAAVFSQNAGFGWVDLGARSVGEPVNLTISWFQEGHFFAFRLAGASGIRTGQINYTVSDVTPPVAPMKLLAARAFVPNCTTQLTSADMDVYFDDVQTN